MAVTTHNINQLKYIILHMLNVYVAGVKSVGRRAETSA